MLLWTHISTVIISIILFNMRVYGYVRRASWSQSQALRILPHINDNVLLFSALAMSFQIQQYPFVHDWLSVKVIFLLLYIVFGILFMHRVRNHSRGWWLYILALFCFGFIVSVAITHNPWGWISLVF